MPTLTDVVSARVVHISEFPRVPGSERVTPRGNIVYAVPPGIKTVAVNAQGVFEVADVTEFSIHPGCEEWVVRTKKRNELVVSQDHSLAVIDLDTLEVVKRVPREAEGLCIPSMRAVGSPRVSGFVVAEFRLRGDGQPKGGVRTKSVLDAVPATFDYGWFIGATAGDGWVSKGQRTGESRTFYNGLCLASGVTNAADVVAKWKQLAATIIEDAVFDDRETPHEFEGSDCVSVKTTVCSAPVARAFETLIGAGAENKHLPEGFLFTPEEFRRGLFLGLLDTDGTACWSKGTAKKAPQFSFSFASVSERLIDEAILLGQSLGIYGSKSGYTRRGHGNYIAVFSTRDVYAARSWVTSLCPQKQAALDRLRAKHADAAPKHSQQEVVPLPPAVKAELLRRVSLGGATRRKSRNAGLFSAYVVLRRSGLTLGRDTAEALVAAVCRPDDTGILARWSALVLNPVLRFDEIAEAKATGVKKVMYDLTVPGPWTFLAANGLALWDCMNMHVAVSDEAVKEALEKMLPSRNLRSPADFAPLWAPRQEFLEGLWRASTAESKSPPRVFDSRKDVVNAFLKGQIGLGDKVIVSDKEPRA